MHDRVKTSSLFLRQISQINTYVCLAIGDFHEILVLMTISVTKEPHQTTLSFKGFMAEDRSDNLNGKSKKKKKLKPAIPYHRRRTIS